jgi:hypothetical protein
VVDWVTLLLRNRKVLAAILVLDTGYPDRSFMAFLTLSSQIPGWYSKLQKFLPQRENQLLFSASHVRHFSLMLRTLPI